jgi:hypothetical protein
VRVEVTDHDNIHDLLVYIEVSESTPEWEVERWLAETRNCLSAFRANFPDNPCLASWSAYFERSGERLAQANAFERRGSRVA